MTGGRDSGGRVDAGRAIGDRVHGLDWAAVARDLDDVGVAAGGALLTEDECRSLAQLWEVEDRFRSTVDMARHRFGQGRYRYFAHPMPEIVARLRSAFWPQLLPIAREWNRRRHQEDLWPDGWDEWLERCHDAGQERPTPLLFRYEPGDWNALHRDLYGELVFPLQVVIGLDEPGVDYTGGEFVVVEQRARAQSRATATVIPRGHCLIFATRDRPVPSARGWAKAPVRHGVSTVRSGRRHTLGLIFHDAR